ncbi:hypothetical protein EHQ47_05000 [Leptospira bourretii]|uniref:polymorphic toxin-type HINT domain-containing protein n=1 Tax=Leptospira bourretii TaxID=2484962 RepID=UPI00109185DB|nr:polymorphic toxin-type HINT domain-containing protein [Leptospira bourretii]TGL23750.1 hypothetical protein EHQ47_05000 [Leptospira bourretii]
MADAAGDPEAFQAKVKELDKDGKLNHPSDEFGTVDTGKSRSGFGVISGFFDDIGRSITGKETSFGSGYIDEKGKFHQRTCFVAGTLVTKLKPEYYVVADQLEPNSKYEEQVAIESIVVSDWVLSKNDETGETSYKRVANTFIRTTDAIYKVSLADGTTLETTWNHPFRVKKQGHALEAFSIENTTWVQAKDLHPGDVALGADGQELVITDIIIDERVETVYNFEVEEYHTYFVGEVGVWVHNDPFGYGAAMHYGNVLQLQACKDQACKEKVTKQITKANEAQIKIVAAEAVLLTGALACTYACPALILAGQNAINRIPSLLQNLGRSNPNAVQQEVKAGQEVAKGGSRVFEVGPYNTLKGVEIGLDAHHVGQKALMSRFIPGYNSGTAPSILVPKMGHTQGTGVLSRNTSGFTNAREVLSRDIFELRRVYSDVPNSSLQKLIEMNKTMYPGAFAK